MPGWNGASETVKFSFVALDDMQSNGLRKYVNSDESAETHKSASRSTCADNLQLLHLVFMQQTNRGGRKSNPIDQILSELWCEIKLQPHSGIIATELWWLQQIEAEPKSWTGTKNNADFWHEFTCLISKTGILPNLAKIVAWGFDSQGI